MANRRERRAAQKINRKLPPQLRASTADLPEPEEGSLRVGTHQGIRDVQFNEDGEPFRIVDPENPEVAQEPEETAQEETTEATEDDAGTPVPVDAPARIRQGAESQLFGETALHLVMLNGLFKDEIMAKAKKGHTGQYDLQPFYLMIMSTLIEQVNHMLVNIGFRWDVPESETVIGYLSGIHYELRVQNAIALGMPLPERKPVIRRDQDGMLEGGYIPERGNYAALEATPLLKELLEVLRSVGDEA